MRAPSAIAFTTVLLAVSVLFLGVAIDFEPGTRGIPVGIAALLCLLLALQLLRDLRTANAALPDEERAAQVVTHLDPAEADRAAIRPVTTIPSETAALGWLLALALLLGLGGMLAGPAAWVVLYLRRRSGEGWLTALAGGAVAAALVWLLLTRVIAAPVPGGLAGWLLAAVMGGAV